MPSSRARSTWARAKPPFSASTRSTAAMAASKVSSPGFSPRICAARIRAWCAVPSCTQFSSSSGSSSTALWAAARPVSMSLAMSEICDQVRWTMAVSGASRSPRSTRLRARSGSLKATRRASFIAAEMRSGSRRAAWR
jgi:hypothetical protein